MEPISPSSSAPQNANRTALLTSGLSPSCTAVSSAAATPDPLSLMPGPSGTESRCAPTITTFSMEPVSVWAITLREWIFLVSALSFKVASPWCSRSFAPCALVMETTGSFTSASTPRVPPIFSSSTLSATISALAPLAAAAASFSENGHSPRSTSTTAPSTGSPS